MDLKKRLRRAYRHYLRNKNWRRIVRMMAAIVVFCTTYALILPAITQETGLICGLTEHVHEDSCYETVVLTDDAGHVHTDTCYQEEKTLQCPLEEQEDHSHTEECYILSKTLICTLPEQEDDGCAAVLVCPMEEHIHDERCYGPTEPAESQAETLPEGNPEADLETAEQWEASFGTLELSGDWSADLVALAKTQLGYGESRENYMLAEDGSVLGYTRYGQWYGEPYAPWDGMFVSFCLHYVGVEGIGLEQDCALWLETLNGQELYRERTQYQPVSGDLIFLDRDGDGSCDHVGIVEAVTEAAEETPGTVQFIAGDWEDRVDRSELAAEDASILGYACLPVEPEDNQPGDPDSDLADAQLQVSLPEDTAVPADAMPVMTPVTEEDQNYADRISQIQDAVEVDTEQVSLLDISFYDEQQNYLPVGETAIVSVQFPGNPFGDNQVKVFHFVDGQAVELEKVAVNSIITADEDGTESVQTQLIFETEGFSVFAVVEVVNSTSQYEQVTSSATALEGNYYILNYDASAAMIAEQTTNNKYGYPALSEAAVADVNQLSSYSMWTFELVSDSDYVICCTDSNGNKQYLAAQYVVSEGIERPDWELGALMLTADEAAATVFTVHLNNGYYTIWYNDGNQIRYITDLVDNDLTNPDTPYGFTMQTARDDATTRQLRLYREIPETIAPLTGLDGREYAIVNLNTATRQFAMTSEHVNNNQKLKAVKVSVTVGQDGITYVSGEGITEWKFISTGSGTDGEYYIQATDTGKYLNLVGNNTENITTSDTPQAIVAAIDSTNGDGQVILSANGTKLNWIGQNASRGDIFGAWAGTDQNSRQTLCVIQGDGLFYDLNAPAGENWYNKPEITIGFQEITTSAVNLLTVQGANQFGSFVYNSSSGRSDVVSYYNQYNNGLGDNLTADNYLSPGAEWRFLGWKATVNGAEYLFPENATATLGDDGYIHIVDVNNVEQTLPPNTTLTGQWKMISDVVMFFVNYSATMLEHEDNQPIVEKVQEGESIYNESFYTKVVAIGHIYTPIATIIPQKIDGVDTIQRSNDALIQAEIVPAYDPNKTGTQIVIDAVARFNENKEYYFETVSNYNQLMLENAVSLYLQNDDEQHRQVRLDNALIDKTEISSDNYKLYWYLQKSVANEGWHIDGVLVAKTQPLTIYKTFSGLTQEQAQTALDSMSFPLYLISTTNGVDEKNTYKTLTAMGSETGVYSYDGRQGEGNIYKWTLESVQGQRYAFEERGYDLTDYDCSSLISVHFKSTQEGVPGAVIWQYNTDQTYTDLDTSANTITDLYKDTPLVGGEVERIIFANFYTKEGTGMFSISKVADADGRVRLAGAKFQLKKGGTVITETTNQNGAAHFSNLEPGTYTLEEIEAPAGYQTLDTQWTVKVEKSDDGVVTVTIDGDLIYDSSQGGIQKIYLIQNDPESTTVTVNKQFKVITDAELAELKDNYRIEITDANGNLKKTLTLADAVASTGTYTWTVDLECKENYTFTEYNYSHNNYLDTVVSAVINGTAAPVAKLDGNTVASFTMTKTEAADTVNITNTYSNTFDLQILKVDATDSDAPMEGVYFNIYGDFHFSTTAPEGTASTISYTDGKGNSQVAYYVGRTAVTDANGMTLFKNMKLSAGTDTFLYVIDEANTPAGYVKLNEPIVRVVQVNGGDDNYHNGVYTLTVENFQEVKATVTVTAEKVWSLPDGMTLADYPDVTLYLYKRVRNVEDDKATDTYSQVETVTLNETTGWKKVWTNLPYAEGNARNEYFVSEVPIDGFATSYSTQVDNFEAGTENVNAAIAEGRELDRSVTITNSTGLKLPDTGGVAGELFGILGLMLMTAAPWQGWLRVKKTKARGHADSK